MIDTQGPSAVDVLPWLKGTIGKQLQTEATGLGPPGQWPPALKSAASLVLQSAFPMFLVWGAERRLLYNDNYTAILGAKHPDALGRSFWEVWPEVRGQIESIVDAAFEGKESFFDNYEIALSRGGKPQPAWFTFSYSPVYDLDGSIPGILCVCVETTSNVHTQARLRFLDQLTTRVAALSDADAIMETTTRLVGEHLGVSICAYADMDEDEDGFTIRGDWSAPGSATIVGRYRLADFGRLAVENLSRGRPLVINDNLREIAPEEAATFQAIGISATICMPLVKDGRLRALMAIHHKDPHVWSDNELALIREVTERSWAHVQRVGAEAELRSHAEQLERLFQASQQEIARRKTVEQQQALLINELNHRVKNTLATVQSIIAQTSRRGDGTELREAIDGRLMALSGAHDLLTRENWEGAELRSLLLRATSPFASEASGRFRLDGPTVKLAPQQALALAMATHELATNAAKYGALSVPEGWVEICWRDGDGSLELEWSEHRGPPVVAPPKRGFGSRLLEKGLANDLQGEVALEFSPGGVQCRITTPLRAAPLPMALS